MLMRTAVQRRVTSGSPAVLSILLGLAVWQALSMIWQAPFLPSVPVVAVRVVEMVSAVNFWEMLTQSLLNMVGGFAIAVVVGVPVGLLMGVSRRVEAALEVYVNAMLTAPPLVFAPVFFSIFGLRREAIIGVVILYSLFIILTNAHAGARTVPKTLVEMAVCYNASRWQIFYKIVLPASLPMLMAGLRLGVGRAIKGMVNGEMFIAIVGMGAVIMTATRAFDAATVLAVVIILLAISVFAIGLVRWVDNRLTGWMPSTARGA